MMLYIQKKKKDLEEREGLPWTPSIKWNGME